MRSARHGSTRKLGSHVTRKCRALGASSASSLGDVCLWQAAASILAPINTDTLTGQLLWCVAQVHTG